MLQRQTLLLLILSLGAQLALGASVSSALYAAVDKRHHTTTTHALAQEAPATRTGRVTDPEGRPIRGIHVKLYHDPHRDGGWTITGDSIVTDSSGVYQLTGLPAAAYLVEFYDGVLPRRYQTEYYDNALTLATATIIALKAGSTVNGIDAQLTTGGRIAGQVTLTNGQPLTNAMVSLYKTACITCGYTVGQTFTDANGDYAFANLKADSYQVGFAYTSWAPPFEYYDNVTQRTNATPLVITASTMITGINAQAPTPGALSGLVTDRHGQPLGNISVDALLALTETNGSLVWSIVNRTSTATDGRYHLPRLLPGRYRLSFSDQFNQPRQYSAQYYNAALRLDYATVISITAGAVVSELVTSLDPTGTISGLVTDATDKPLSNIQVSAQRLISDEGSNSRWLLGGSIVSDLTGAYTLVGLDAGRYRLVFSDSVLPPYYATEYYDNIADPRYANTVDLAPEQHITGINAQINVGNYLSGRVTDTAGQAVANIDVALFRAVEDRIGKLNWGYVGNAITAANGSYTLAAPAAGFYRVAFFDWTSSYQSAFYPTAVTLASATTIAVRGGQNVLNLDAQLPAHSALNVAPLARNDAIRIHTTSVARDHQSNEPTVLSNDRDPNGDGLTAQLVVNGERGTVTLQPDGTFRYTPAYQGVSSDRFTYQITDGVYTSNIATVALQIERVEYRVMLPLIRNK